MNVLENALRSVSSPSIEREDLVFKRHGQFTFSVKNERFTAKEHYRTVIQRLWTLKDTGRLRTPRDSIGDCEGDGDWTVTEIKRYQITF